MGIEVVDNGNPFLIRTGSHRGAKSAKESQELFEISMKGNIKTYHFLPNKYGRELLLDIGRIEKIPNFNFGVEPHQLSFYDILFIDKGAGHLMLDENKIALKPGTIIFTSPGNTREWRIKKPVGGYAIFFEKDFLFKFPNIIWF